MLLYSIKSHTAKISRLSFELPQLSLKGKECKTQSQFWPGDTHIYSSEQPRDCLRHTNVCHQRIFLMDVQSPLLPPNCQSAAATNSILLHLFILGKETLRWNTLLFSATAFQLQMMS